MSTQCRRSSSHLPHHAVNFHAFFYSNSNANANANANVSSVLFVAAFKPIRSIPYLLNDCSFSLPLGCARSDTTFHQARRNFITQKNENLKICRQHFYPCDGTRKKFAPVKSSTWSRGSDLKISISSVVHGTQTHKINQNS